MHNVDQHRFEIQVGDHLAYLSYSSDGERVIMDHTYVPEALRGRGMAGTLARAALEEARRQGWKIVPQCSFVATFIARHPEFAGLVASAETK